MNEIAAFTSPGSAASVLLCLVAVRLAPAAPHELAGAQP